MATLRPLRPLASLHAHNTWEFHKEDNGKVYTVILRCSVQRPPPDATAGKIVPVLSDMTD